MKYMYLVEHGHRLACITCFRRRQGVSFITSRASQKGNFDHVLEHSIAESRPEPKA